MPVAQTGLFILGGGNCSPVTHAQAQAEAAPVTYSARIYTMGMGHSGPFQYNGLSEPPKVRHTQMQSEFTWMSLNNYQSLPWNSFNASLLETTTMYEISVKKPDGGEDIIQCRGDFTIWFSKERSR